MYSGFRRFGSISSGQLFDGFLEGAYVGFKLGRLRGGGLLTCLDECPAVFDKIPGGWRQIGFTGGWFGLWETIISAGL